MIAVLMTVVMNRGIEMVDACEGCDHAQIECIKNKPLCRKDIVFCQECSAGIDWDKLDKTSPELIITIQESHPYGSTTAVETLVVGFVCPECGTRNMF
jgi:hypothetical protein